MRIRHIVILLLVSIMFCRTITAQEATEKKDSAELYRNIESYSKKSRFKTSIFRLFFKPVTPATGKKAAVKKRYRKLIQKPYNSFEGKAIRKIEVVTQDPFGFSVTDTSTGKQNFFIKAGNSLHVKTKGITIQNLMLIHKNTPFNSLRVKESERLIRNQNYVHDVTFNVVQSGTNGDSVDILIRELDYWSIIPQGSLSHSGYNIGLTDRNFLGTGHEFRDIYKSDKTNDVNTFISDYFIPNFRNTYISSNLHYEINSDRYFNRSIKIDRPFFSPLAKWGAGVSFASRFKRDSLNYPDTAYIPLNLKFKTGDFWIGFARQIFFNNSEDDLLSNLTFTLRYLRIRYSVKPLQPYNALNAYSNEDFVLGEIGISSRKYVQDKFIFKFGIIEDVPVGKYIGLTGGYQIKSASRRQYAGIRFSNATYYQWGYLSSNLEFGTFFNAAHFQQSVLAARIDYFSGLFEIGKWKFRQFVKPQFTLGMNMLSYDSLTLKEGYGLNGFNSNALTGTRRMLVTIQTQSYAPWYLLGFRFGPYLTYTIGMLGDSKSGFRSSKAYSQLGIGVLIKNEFLRFSNFQISISFYPVIPGVGRNVYKMNSYRTTDFGIHDFDIGKPSVVAFR
jgi:hypothetical protein